MTLTRFKTLKRMLRFDNRNTMNARLHGDKLAAVRLLNGLVNDHQSCYLPGSTATEDKQLFPFRGRCMYFQCIPSKPVVKYGLKFWSVNDSATAYCWNLQMYTGKDET